MHHAARVCKASSKAFTVTALLILAACGHPSGEQAPSSDTSSLGNSRRVSRCIEWRYTRGADSIGTIRVYNYCQTQETVNVDVRKGPDFNCRTIPALGSRDFNYQRLIDFSPRRKWIKLTLGCRPGD